ncbi:MAG: methyl-accepting chemotaxis protein [Defluviitaleaceae bacterium]|nr:methyl-accepting chemotaxis protein [Defluviitaleaceae bacterium]
MNFRTIGIKLLLVSLVSIVLMSLAFILLMLNGSRQISYQLSRQHMEISVYSVDNMISQIKDNTLMTASQFANNTAIATGVQTNNAAAVLSQINATMSQQGVYESSYIVIVTDRFGRVIARYHNDTAGDDVSHFPVVTFALNNMPMSDIEFHWETPLSIVSAAPIIGFGGSVLGVVVVGYDMGSESFVNTLKATTGAEIAVFAHDTSIATTFGAGSPFDEGSRIQQSVGYPVLAHRNYIYVPQTILGQSFLSYYAPIMDGDGQIIGLLFMGQNLSAARQAERFMMIVTIIAAIVIAGAALLISSWLNNRMIVQPVKRISRDLTQLSKGNININRTSNISNDEIGALTSDVFDLVDIVRSMVDDLTKLDHEYNVVGDIDYRIDSKKYENSFKEMMDGVNNIPENSVRDILALLDALGEINNGNFDLTVKDLSGKKMVLPNAVRATIVNLQGVSSEVNAMIEAAVVKGDLNFHVDEAKYKGDWRKIMAGLNSIAKAVDKPLQVIKISFDEIKAGRFDLAALDKKIRDMGYEPNAQSYNGVFRDTMMAIDTTVLDISSYINELEQILAQMAEGDLRYKIERDYVGSFDLIKRSVNNINNTLHKTLSEISITADQVLSGVAQISTSAADLASGAQQQASSIQELNATIDMISQQTRQNADSASTATTLSEKSASDAKEGNGAMNQTMEAMTQIKEASGNISKIIKTIQDIAFQTNLLALNASVEAARAGEHGRGFAVVADEVRNLAGRSQEAANETTTLIQDSINRVEIGSKIAESTSVSLDAIVASSSEVLEIIDSISTASQLQADAISQVGGGLEQISIVTQSNSAVSEETATAAAELNSQAEVLQQLVTFFKL